MSFFNPRRRLSIFSVISGVLTVLFVCGLLLLILIGMGQVNGTEFSPDDFSQRRFSYNQVPGLGWILFKKSYDKIPNAIQLQLELDALLPPTNGPEQTWHLTAENSGSGGLISSDCDARFLTAYLNMTDQGGKRGSFWSAWHNDFPEQSKIFWPLVAQLARDRLYLKIPPIMEFAIHLDAAKTADFQAVLHQKVAAAYSELAEIDFEMGNFKRAGERFTSADLLCPDLHTKQRIKDCQTSLLARESAAVDSDPSTF